LIEKEREKKKGKEQFIIDKEANKLRETEMKKTKGREVSMS